MKYCLGFFFVWSLSWFASAQISEPVQGDRSQEEYMIMLIDSLEIAEGKRDTLNVVRFASTLTTEFQRIRVKKEAKKYLEIALSYSSRFSNPSLYYEVCNRAGMLVYSFKNDDIAQNVPLEHILKWSDSSLVWHRKPIVAQEATIGSKGWAYRAMLQVTLTKYLETKGIHLMDSIDLYYEKGIGLAEATDDSQLLFALANRYTTFLNFSGQLEKAEQILNTLRTKVDDQGDVNLSSYYFNVATNIAMRNGLDTIVSLHKRQNASRLRKDVSELNQEVFNADKKYEVTKTKGELESTQEELVQSRIILFTSLAGALLILVSLFYFYRLNNKNKRLSMRNELLLKEQNHRVKNNLQMINSLLSLQSQKLLSTDAKDALNESQLRINSVALLHRMLYEGDETGTVNASEYLKTLTDEISYAVPRSVEVGLQIDNYLNLPIEKATSLGLIINELVTNSIKHVDEEVELMIEISIAANDSGEMTLNYSDNGDGVDEKTWRSSTSFGNQLIRLQSEQLRGAYKVNGDQGFGYELRIGA